MDHRHPIKPGFLEVYCGPMKCGKTRELIHRVDMVDHMPAYKFVFAKPTVDTRDVVLHSRFFGEQKNYGCKMIDPNNPMELLEIVNDTYHLVAIDEAQFFSDCLTKTIEEFLRRKKNVVVAGLDLDFKGEPFGPMPQILAMADQVTKLVAVCEYPLDDEKCGGVATRTQRLIGGKPARYDAPLVVIEGSGAETYEARCLSHHEVPRE